MYKTLRKVLLPLLLVVALVCTSLLAVACKPDVEEPAKVTYSVTVTLDSDVTGVTLTSLKAQWMSGTTAASEQIALNAEGKASVELEEGNYTVELIGVPATAEYTKASVTAAKPDATIKISQKAPVGPTAQKLAAPTGLKVVDGTLSWNAVANASGYIVYDGANKLGEVAASVLSYDVSALAVGNHTLAVVAKGDGTNYLDSDKATISHKVEDSEQPSAVTPEGGSDYWYEDESWEWAHHEGAPYAISAVGKYYIPVLFSVNEIQVPEEYGGGSYTETNIYAHTIKFVATEDGEHSYTFSWDSEIYSLTYKNGPYDLGLQDDCLIVDEENGSLLFSLSKGDEIIIVLAYNYNYYENPLTEGDEIGFELTIESGDPISEGSIVKPFVIDEIEGAHSAPEGYSDSKAYFVLPMNDNYYTYVITFAEGVQVYVLQAGRNSAPVSIASGDELTPAEYSNTYLYVVASNGSSIEFSFEKTIRTGSSEKPIVLNKDEEASYYFADGHSVWYCFTAEASQLYHIAVSGTSVSVYSSIPTSYDEYPLFEVNSDGKTDFYLESGVYYIELVGSWGNDATLKISDSSSESGAILNPIELNLGSNSANYSNTDILYFVYSATADATITLRHDAEWGVVIYMFSDANYTVALGDPHYDSFSFSVKANDVIYIYITSYNNLTINLLVSLDAPQNVKVEGGILTWDAVEGAVGYNIFDGDQFLATVDASEEQLGFNLNRAQLSIGKHSISVVAIGDDDRYLDSNKSVAVEYVVSVQLAAPSLNIINGNGLDWEEVDGASSYEVYMNGNLVATVQVSYYEISGLSSGSYKFYVIAKGDGEVYLDSDKSEEIEYSLGNYANITIDEEANNVVIGSSESATVLYLSGNDETYMTPYVITIKAAEGVSIYVSQGEVLYPFTYNAESQSYVLNIIFTSSSVSIYASQEITATSIEIVEGKLEPLTIALELGSSLADQFLIMHLSAAAYSFTAAKVGFYSIQLTDLVGITSASDVVVNNGEVLAGVLSADGKTLRFDFIADSILAFDYIGVYNMTGNEDSDDIGRYISYTVTIVELENWTQACGDFVLGDELKITLTGDNTVDNPDRIKTVTFIAPVTGVYKLTVDGIIVDFYGPMWGADVEDKENKIKVVDPDAKDEWPYYTLGDIGVAEFNGIKGKTYTFTITKQVSATVGDVNLTLVMNLIEIKEEVLAPGETVNATIGTRDNQRASQIKLDVDKITAGNEYTIFVKFTAGLGSLTELTLIYNDQEISLPLLSSDSGKDGFEGKFTAVDGVNTLWIYSTKSSLQPTTVSLEAVLVEPDLIPGGSYEYEVSQSKTKILLGSLVVGEQYTLKINGWSGVYSDIHVIYNGNEAGFSNVDYNEAVYKFTAVEGVNTLEIYATNGDYTEFGITSLTLYLEGKLGGEEEGLVLTVGGSVTFNLSEEHTVISLSGLQTGTTYVLTGEFYTRWVEGIHCVYGALDQTFIGVDYTYCTIEFYYTELVEPSIIEIFTEAGSECSWPDATFTLTVKA